MLCMVGRAEGDAMKKERQHGALQSGTWKPLENSRIVCSMWPEMVPKLYCACICQHSIEVSQPMFSLFAANLLSRFLFSKVWLKCYKKSEVAKGNSSRE